MNSLGKMGIILVLMLIGFGLERIFYENRDEGEKVPVFIYPTITENRVKIAVMADIHNDEEQFSKMLEMARNNKVEIVVVAGDLTNGGSRGELVKMKDILVNSTLKYAVVPGDHEKNLNDFKNVFGENYQSIKLGKVKLILIDNSSWHGLGESQKKWIEAQVTDCGDYVCIGIMHKALNNLLSLQVMGENNKKVEDEADWLRELLIKAGVKQIEVGDLHYASSYELEGIRTDVVGAISSKDNNQSPRYTELMIGRNIVEREVIVGEEL